MSSQADQTVEDVEAKEMVQAAEEDEEDGQEDREDEDQGEADGEFDREEEDNEEDLEVAEDAPEKILEDYDQNKDGKLTLVEFTAGWDEKYEFLPHEISNIFAGADQDKDGMLNLEEGKVFLKELNQEVDDEQKKEEAKESLENYDENADGKLTLVDFHFLVGLGRMKANRQQFLDLFASADHDKDGMLNFEELEVVLARLDQEEA